MSRQVEAWRALPLRAQLNVIDALKAVITEDDTNASFDAVAQQDIEATIECLESIADGGA